VKATRWLLAAGLAAAAASRCAAHERNVSHSSWIIRGREAHVLVRFAEIEFGSLPDDRGLRERRRAVVVRDVRIRAGVEELCHELGIVVVSGPVQRCRAVGGLGIRIGASAKPGDYRRRVIALRGID